MKLYMFPGGIKYLGCWVNRYKFAWAVCSVSKFSASSRVVCKFVWVRVCYVFPPSKFVCGMKCPRLPLVPTGWTCAAWPASEYPADMSIGCRPTSVCICRSMLPRCRFFGGIKCSLVLQALTEGTCAARSVSEFYPDMVIDGRLVSGCGNCVLSRCKFVCTIKYPLVLLAPTECPCAQWSGSKFSVIAATDCRFMSDCACVHFRDVKFFVA